MGLEGVGLGIGGGLDCGLGGFLFWIIGSRIIIRSGLVFVVKFTRTKNVIIPNMRV